MPAARTAAAAGLFGLYSHSCNLHFLDVGRSPRKRGRRRVGVVAVSVICLFASRPHCAIWGSLFFFFLLLSLPLIKSSLVVKVLLIVVAVEQCVANYLSVALLTMVPMDFNGLPMGTNIAFKRCSVFSKRPNQIFSFNSFMTAFECLPL